MAIKLKEFATTLVAVVEPDTSARVVAQLMRRHHIGALVVVDAGDKNKPVGIVTDRDLVVNVLAQGRTPDEQAVGAYSSVHLVRVPGSATVHEAIQAMHHHGVRRVFVTAPDGRLMGLLSLDDLLATLADDLNGLSEALRFGIDMESVRTSPMFRADELPTQLYLAQHEP